MAAPKGNQNAVGNSGGRPPTVKEQIWHRDKWEENTKVRELESKVASGEYSVRDVYLLKALKADTVILKNMADKVLADLHDLRGKDGGPIETLVAFDPKYKLIADEFEEKLRKSIIDS